ncbi:hypothetical protein EPO05_02805 [Patescibacteria group bacterium]|nr:MAG: hypothetical protein EPO05_02805 [Patescibacteria group bacterium]
MHDFLLAKEIVDAVLKEVNERSLKGVKEVHVSVGSVSLAHDGFPEHVEDVSLENLTFSLEAIANQTALKGTKFTVDKSPGHHWSIEKLVV